MPRTVIAQISDPHITGPGDELFEGSDPVGNLTKALQHASQRSIFFQSVALKEHYSFQIVVTYLIVARFKSLGPT
jgi:hypothetical protein